MLKKNSILRKSENHDLTYIEENFMKRIQKRDLNDYAFIEQCNKNKFLLCNTIYIVERRGGPIKVPRFYFIEGRASVKTYYTNFFAFQQKVP